MTSLSRQLETTAARSELMRRVRTEGTAPELAVRRTLHALGGRYRLNCCELPGSPDIVNRSRRLAIFVHGCFWHFHAGCARIRLPKRNRDFWKNKLLGNRARDARATAKLAALGYSVLVVWECEVSDPHLPIRLADFWGVGSIKGAG